MTSPPLTLPVASAEQSSEDGRTERAPRPASGDSPLSWGHPSPLASLPYGSPYPFDLSAYPAPWVHHHHQLPQILNNSSTTRRSLPLPNLIKQTASPSKTPSTKSRRKNKSSSQPSVAPTLSTGALFTPAPNQGAPKRASSRVRTSKSSGSRALTHTRVSEVGQRLPECLWRSALHSLSADPGTSTGARVDDEGDIPLPVTSRCPHTTASENSQARLSLYNSSGVPEISGSSSAGLTSPSYDAFSNPAASESSPAGLPSPAHNSSRIPLASESGLAGLTSSSCSREHTDASIVNNSKLFVPSPSFSASEITGLRESKALRTVRPSIHISPCLSSSIPTPWSSHEPSQSSRSSGTPYGSIGVPIPSPPYQILPTPKPSASRQNPTYSLEANGYAIIRNAISPALVREVVASIDRGLPVIARSEAKQTYATTLEANKVQDEFVLKWRPALRSFFEPMGKMIPEMPRKSIIGSFTAGDPKDSRQALAHVGNKDELYVHIALTTLPPESDFYHMLKVSDHDQEHIARIMLNERNKTPMILQEGDAVIWRGDMHCLLSPRGGGEALAESYIQLRSMHNRFDRLIPEEMVFTERDVVFHLPPDPI